MPPVPDPPAPYGDDEDEVEEKSVREFDGPVRMERDFEVDGRKLTVRVTFPAPVVEEAGMENLVMASNRAVWELESNSHEIEDL